MSEQANQYPVAWLHRIKEPGREELRLLSFSPNNPWGHWIESHRLRCDYSAVPLFEGQDADPSTATASEGEDAA